MELQVNVASADELDDSLAMIDVTNVRAHQQAAGAKKGEVAEPELGRSRGGWGSKFHLVTERTGKPIVCALSNLHNFFS